MQTDEMKRLAWLAFLAFVVGTGFVWFGKKVVGRQPSGEFVVSTGQTILPGTLKFSGRPMELAVHPRDGLFAVATNREVFLANSTSILDSTRKKLDAGVSYRGMTWSADGSRLYVSLSNGK